MTRAVSIAQGGSNNVTMRNRIINGAMVIDQRNAGASVAVTDSSYAVDRFVNRTSQNGKLTAQRTPSATETGYATRVAAGFSNYLAFTSLSAYSPISSDYIGLCHNVEGFNFADMAWGTASAKTVTLSFWAYSSLTGQMGGAFRNAAQDRSYPFSYTINAANTWEYKTITVPGDTTGTWVGATNGIAVQVWFNLGTGSSSSGVAGAWAGAGYINSTGSTAIVGTNGATFYITGVQLEAGTTATPFEQRLYGTELALCQRYCEVIRPTGVTNYAGISIGACISGTTAKVGYYYQVAKRAAPTITYSGASFYCLTSSSDSAFACTSISTDRSDVTMLMTAASVSSGLVAGNATRLLDNGTSIPVTIISAEL